MGWARLEAAARRERVEETRGEGRTGRPRRCKFGRSVGRKRRRENYARLLRNESRCDYLPLPLPPLPFFVSHYLVVVERTFIPLAIIPPWSMPRMGTRGGGGGGSRGDERGLAGEGVDDGERERSKNARTPRTFYSIRRVRCEGVTAACRGRERPSSRRPRTMTRPLFAHRAAAAAQMDPFRSGGRAIIIGLRSSSMQAGRKEGRKEGRTDGTHKLRATMYKAEREDHRENAERDAWRRGDERRKEEYGFWRPGYPPHSLSFHGGRFPLLPLPLPPLRRLQSEGAFRDGGQDWRPSVAQVGW